MRLRQPKLDPRLHWLRVAHRSERAPQALRQRALGAAAALPSRTDAAPRPKHSLARRWGWGLAIAAASVLGLGVLRSAVSDDLLVAPQARGHVVPAVEPSGSQHASGPRCTLPLPISPWNLTQTDGKLTGLEPEVFEQPTQGCGPLRRRYLVRTPASATALAPLLIVLHAAGQSAEQAQLETRWWFDDLAQREGAVLVYANGSPSLKKTENGAIHAGVWQTDDGVHPAVDDVAYLQGLVDDLRRRRGLDPAGEVFLAGYGSGAWMALAAAGRQPERYAGVAAFLPAGGDPSGLYKGIASAGRTRVFVVLPITTEERSLLALSWSAALGGKPGPVRVQYREPGIDQIDTASGPVALRLLRLGPRLDPFPGPGAADPIARASSERRASFIDGSAAAWAFWHETKR